MDKFNRNFPNYDDDSDYNTNANSYYKYLGRKNKLIKLLAKRIWEYDERLDNRLEELEIVLNDYLSQWDERIENLDDEVSHIFVTWLNDGTLEQIINDDVLGNKADKDYVDDLNESVTKQLVQTENHFFSNSTINHKKPRPMITIVDDDGNRGFYTKLFELAKEYNIPFTSAMITDYPMGFPEDDREYNNKYYHYDEVMEMKESGLIEFVDHFTHSNPDYRPSQMTDKELHEHYSKSKNFLRKHGLNHNVHVYPFAEWDERLSSFTRQYFNAGIGGDFATYGKSYVKHPMDQYHIPRVTGLDRSTVESIQYIKDQIDETKQANSWLILTSHVDQSGGANIEHFREVIEYALSQGLEFVTTEEGLAHHGNLTQTGKQTINHEGVLYGGLTVEKLDSYAPNAPITEFPLGTVTIVPVRYADSEVLNLPVGRVGGNLEVHRGHQGDDFSYERYITNGYKRVFYRYWNTATNEWSEFIDFINVNNTLNIVGLDRFEPNAPLTEYPEENVTIMPIRHSQGIELNLPGLDSGASGMLETHRYPGSSTFSYQKFIATTLSRVFYRYWNGESWSAFREPGIHQSKIVSGSVTYTEEAGSTQFLKYEGGNLPSEPKSVVIAPMGLDSNITFSLVSYSDVNFGVRASKTDITFSYIAVL